MTKKYSQNTKVAELRTMDVVGQEAADWFVKLDNTLDNGGLSESEWRDFKCWLSISPLHGQVLKRQAEMWSDMDFLAREIDVQSTRGFWDVFSRTRFFQRGVAFACVLLVAVAISVFYPIADGVDVQDNLYATQVGDNRIELLSDGSSVHMNTNSLIKVEFSDTQRAVTLVRGEAIFDVAHEPERPFVVYADGQVVTAIGTRFVVRLTSDKIRVTVTEGKVKLAAKLQENNSLPVAVSRALDVSGEQEAVLLVQGQRAEVTKQGETHTPVLVEVDQGKLEKDLAWVKGRFIFEDESLETIIAEVNRYTNTDVVLVDPGLKNIRLSGRFQVGDTEALLEAIEISAQNIKITKPDNGNTIYLESLSQSFP
ncbi:FecR family protein [Porticoccus sp. GXU_MW_L64]